MKKLLLWMVVLILSISMVAAFSFAGCKAEEKVAVEEVAEEEVAEEAPTEEVAEEVVAEEQLIFYWLSHGSEGDPIWAYELSSVNEVAAALNVRVNSSFHSGDVALQKEAFNAAIAANADGIAVSCPQEGVFNDEVKAAHEKGIPVVFFNADDPATGRDAYVGADNYNVGVAKAKYLVDNNLVTEGDNVWLPVEIPGLSYGADQTKGIDTIFKPLGINYELFDAKYDPVETLNNMVDFLTAHGNEIQAMIGLGDMVTEFAQPAFEQVGWEAGHIPVVGWGNSLGTAQSVKEGFVNAAVWQFPDAQGYMPIFLLYQAANGKAINYNVYTYGWYDETNVDKFIEILSKMQ